MTSSDDAPSLPAAPQATVPDETTPRCDNARLAGSICRASRASSTFSSFETSCREADAHSEISYGCYDDVRSSAVADVNDQPSAVLRTSSVWSGMDDSDLLESASRCANLFFGRIAAQPDERAGFDRLVIHPTNRLKLLYEAVLTLLTFVTAVVSPLQARASMRTRGTGGRTGGA